MKKAQQVLKNASHPVTHAALHPLRNHVQVVHAMKPLVVAACKCVSVVNDACPNSKCH